MAWMGTLGSAIHAICRPSQRTRNQLPGTDSDSVTVSPEARSLRTQSVHDSWPSSTSEVLASASSACPGQRGRSCRLWLVPNLGGPGGGLLNPPIPGQRPISEWAQLSVRFGFMSHRFDLFKEVLMCLVGLFQQIKPVALFDLWTNFE